MSRVPQRAIRGGIDLDERGTVRLLAAVLLAACTPASVPTSDAPPAAPGKAYSSAFTVTGARTWSIIGDALTPGDTEASFSVKGQADVVDVWLDGRHTQRVADHDGFKVSFSVADLAPGSHQLLLQADAAATAFAALELQRSHPMYVVVSNDWDTGDHTDDKLERQDRLHSRHPELVITHFVGPYTFTDPTVSTARAQYLVNWLNNYRTTKRDEIGLHIHPYCNFVEAAGVTCRTSPSFAYASDTTGYTVILASYTQPELETLFAKADALFAANGLPKPTSFRAGGWTADLHVLKALAASGFVADTSAVNWARLEEWQGKPGAQLYPWNEEHWMPIDESSQPYYPATTDVLADTAPHISLLEVPDNGALVDYVTGPEMIQMFHTNFSGDPLAETRTYSIGYHPVDFSEEFFTRIDQALTEIDTHLAADDHGPVIYARLSDMPKVY